jgi:LysM repeat protein
MIKVGRPTQPYTIKAGDTFWNLANEQGIAYSTEALLKYNPEVVPEQLNIGQVIRNLPK